LAIGAKAGWLLTAYRLLAPGLIVFSGLTGRDRRDELKWFLGSKYGRVLCKRALRMFYLFRVRSVTRMQKVSQTAAAA
jgi:hypothetical protein